MYKDIIKDVYRKVTNRKNKRRYPRILDYVDTVIEKENANFFKENGDEVIHKKREKIRRSVSNALAVLEEEGILGKIDNHYVAIEVYREYHARLFLLENLHLRKNSVVQVSKRVFVISVETDNHAHDFPLENQTSNESKKDLNETEKMQAEIALLKKQVGLLLQEKRRKIEMENLKENLARFLGHENFISIFDIEGSIVIVFDTDDKSQKDIVNKLKSLIKEIANKKVRLISNKQKKKRRISRCVRYPSSF